MLAGLQNLTSRERDVLRYVMNAYSSKQRAKALGNSSRAVEFYRSRVLGELGAKSPADLMKIVAGLMASQPSPGSQPTYSR